MNGLVKAVTLREQMVAAFAQGTIDLVVPTSLEQEIANLRTKVALLQDRLEVAEMVVQVAQRALKIMLLPDNGDEIAVDVSDLDLGPSVVFITHHTPVGSKVSCLSLKE